jgi:hypothetical protein
MFILARRAGGAVLAAALVVLPANQASADEPRVELIAHVGYANAGSKPVTTYDFAVRNVPFPTLENGQVAPFRGGFAGEPAGGWRFTEALSAGAVLGFRMSSVDPSVGLATDRDLSRSAWTLGGYMRWSPALEAMWLRPWVSLGVGLAIDSESFLLVTEGGNSQTTVRNFGLAIPLQAGVGFRLVPALSIGPFASYSPVIGLGANDSSNGASQINALTYGVWGLGLEARVVAF